MPDAADNPYILDLYLSGDLDTTQARKTEEHLERCVSCRDELEALASMMQAVERASRELSRNNLRIVPESHPGDAVPAAAPPSPAGTFSMSGPGRTTPSLTASSLPPAAASTRGAAPSTKVSRATR